MSRERHTVAGCRAFGHLAVTEAQSVSLLLARAEARLRRLKSRIRNALDEHRLVLYAQSIINVNRRRVVMHELLVRMIDHDGAIIAPGRFLPAAEECGLIEEIDRWVIIQAAQPAGGRRCEGALQHLRQVTWFSRADQRSRPHACNSR